MLSPRARSSIEGGAFHGRAPRATASTSSGALYAVPARREGGRHAPHQPLDRRHSSSPARRAAPARSTTRRPASSRPRSTSPPSRRSTRAVAAAAAAFPAWRATSLSRRSRGDVPLPRAGRRQPQGDRRPAHRRARQGRCPTPWARWPAASRTSSSPAASPTCSRAATASRRPPASTCTRSASRSASSPASRRSTSRPWCRCGCSANAIACGNTFVLKPSEKDPSASLLLADLLRQAGLPDGVFNVVQGDKVAVDRLLDHPDIDAVSFVGSTPIARYDLRDGHARRQAGAGPRRRQEPHGRAARRRPRHGRRRRGVRRRTARPASAAWPSRSSSPSATSPTRSSTPSPTRLPTLQVGPGHRPEQRDGPAHHRASTATGSPATSTRRADGGRHRRGRRPRRTAVPGDGLLPRRVAASTTSRRTWTVYTDEIFGPVLSRRAGRHLRRGACGWSTTTRTATARPSSPATAAPPGSSSSTPSAAWSASTSPSRCPSPTTASAAGRRRCSATPTCTAPRACTSTRGPRS